MHLAHYSVIILLDNNPVRQASITPYSADRSTLKQRKFVLLQALQLVHSRGNIPEDFPADSSTSSPLHYYQCISYLIILSLSEGNPLNPATQQIFSFPHSMLLKLFSHPGFPGTDANNRTPTGLWSFFAYTESITETPQLTGKGLTTLTLTNVFTAMMAISGWLLA